MMSKLWTRRVQSITRAISWAARFAQHVRLGSIGPADGTQRGSQAPAPLDCARDFRARSKAQANTHALSRAARLAPCAALALLLAPAWLAAEPGKSSLAAGAVAIGRIQHTPTMLANQPRAWLPSRGPECIEHGPNRGFCAGPRRVPKPFGSAAQLAQRLDLGDRRSCAFLLAQPPDTRWVQAASKAGGTKQWVFPIDGGLLSRGVGNLSGAERRRRAQFSAHPPLHNPKRHEHEGLDIAAPLGAPIRAAQSGLVVYSDNGLTGYGNVLLVVHKDGSVALYAHCSATYVFAGQYVESGQPIAAVGHTGYARGDHLHFEYRVNGFARDPLPLFAPGSVRAIQPTRITTPRTRP
jgi:murein DD-endopeptidase MepM/ murein hydrolase activator NlpD